MFFSSALILCVNKRSPVKLFPYFIELACFDLELLFSILLSCFHLVRFHSQCCCNYLVAEITIPVFFIFNYMGIAITQTKVNIKIFHLSRNLFINTSFLFPYIYYLFVSCPEPLYIFKRLFKEKWHIISFFQRNP